MDDMMMGFDNGIVPDVSVMDMFTLADTLRAARDHKDALKAELEEVNRAIEQIDTQLSEAMLTADCPNFKRKDKLFYLKTRLFASAKDGQKQRLYQALKDAGYGDLVYETVNANTLNSFVKEQLEENGGEELPAWLAEVVKTTDKVSVGVRKG